MAKHINGIHRTMSLSPQSSLLPTSVSSSTNPRKTHAHLIKTTFFSHIFPWNCLIYAYVKSGHPYPALKVFDEMSYKNTFTWNSAMDALFRSPDLDRAAHLFELIPVPDQCSWNTVVSGFTRHGWSTAALLYLSRMNRTAIPLDAYTIPAGLRACAHLADIRTGTELHAMAAKSPSLSAVQVGSALVDMYGKCGDVDAARKVFGHMPVVNTVSWNALLSCLEQNGPVGGTVSVFGEMLALGFEPDECTLSTVLSACASLSEPGLGRRIHARVVTSGQLLDDLFICNALVDMYSKCGMVAHASAVFDQMPTRTTVTETTMVGGLTRAAAMDSAGVLFENMTEKNIISWNALIAGYMNMGEAEDAVRLFLRLKMDDVRPTHYTLGNILNAAAALSDIRLGLEVHGHVVKHGFGLADVFVANSLIDMYMKCGSVADAEAVFQTTAERDVVSYNAMIIGHGRNGGGREALQVFDEMLAAGERPDGVTMVGVLSACGRTGSVDDGWGHFKSLWEVYGISPTRDHYTCMVELLGRAGRIVEAKRLIETMEGECTDTIVWGSLLAACNIHGDMDTGEFVAGKLVAMEPENTGHYVLLSNMFAEGRRWGDVVSVRREMRENGLVKQPGCSWIETSSNGVHVFMVKDRSHIQNREIYILLHVLVDHMRSVREDLEDLYSY